MSQLGMIFPKLGMVSQLGEVSQLRYLYYPEKDSWLGNVSNWERFSQNWEWFPRTRNGFPTGKGFPTEISLLSGKRFLTGKWLPPWRGFPIEKCFITEKVSQLGKVSLLGKVSRSRYSLLMVNLRQRAHIWKWANSSQNPQKRETFPRRNNGE